MLIQHRARRSGRPNLRKSWVAGINSGDGLAIVGYDALTRSAMRHASRVEICLSHNNANEPPYRIFGGVEGPSQRLQSYGLGKDEVFERRQALRWRRVQGLD